MSLQHILKIGILTVVLLTFASTAALADVQTVKFGVNTSSIAGGSYFLAFQLEDGSGTGDANNTVTLSDFAFGGGSALDPAVRPTLYSYPALNGGASGDLLAGVALTDSDPYFNAAILGFDAGTELTFDASFTNNKDTGSFPDLFLVSILDSTGAGISTADSNNDSFITVTLDGTKVTQPNGAVTPPTQFFAASAPYEIPAPAAVPEASSLLLLAACCGFLGLWPKLRARLSNQ